MLLFPFLYQCARSVLNKCSRALQVMVALPAPEMVLFSVQGNNFIEDFFLNR